LPRSSENATPSLAANILFSSLSWGGPLIFAFIATPYLIRGLGVEVYGYYSLVLVVIGSGFTMGVGKVSAKYIPEYRANGNSTELTRILSASLTLTFAAAVIQASILALASPFIVEDILNVPNSAQSELKTAIYLACLIGPVMMVSQLFQSAAQGLNIFKPATFIINVSAIALNAGAVVLAINGSSYTTILIWNLAVSFLVMIAFFLYVKPRLPELKLQNRADGAVFRKVGRFTLSIFIYQTITSVFAIFERAYVIRTFGSEALTYYVVPLLLGAYLHALIVSFSNAITPKINETIDRPDRLKGFYVLSTKLMLAVSALIAGGYIALGRQFLTLWLGEDFGVRSFSPLVIHSLAFALIACSINSWILAEAAHRPGMNALTSSLISILGIVGIIVLSFQYGLAGTASGRLIGAIAVLPLVPYLEKKVFGAPMLSLWAGAFVRLTAAAAVAVTVTRIVSVYLPMNWLFLALSVAFFVLSFAAVLFVLRFVTKNEFRELETWIERGAAVPNQTDNLTIVR